MRWFKHFTDNHRGLSIQRLLDEMGHAGLAYYIIMEMCAEKLEKGPDGSTGLDDCIFVFNRKLIQNQTRLKSFRIDLLLTLCSESNLLRWEPVGNDIKIEMPILLELLEKNFSKRPKKGLSKASHRPLELDIEKNLEKEKEEPPKSPINFIELWNKNCGSLAKVVKTNAARNTRILQRMKEAPDEEWIEVIKKIAASDFCNGKNNKKWKADFDWLLQPEVRLKVIEGKYDNSKSHDPFEFMNKTEAI